MLERHLANFGAIPFTRGALLPLLANYHRPNDKISEWLQKGVLISLKRGLYMVGKDWRHEEISLPLIANHLYGPSCVSLDYALAWHGLIPERVIEVTSVSIHRSRLFENKMGRFSYTKIPTKLYKVGLQIVKEEKHSFLLASPEKALCDKILSTSYLKAIGQSSMKTFLFEDLRINAELLQDFNLEIIEAYANSGHKQRQLSALYRVLKEI